MEELTISQVARQAGIRPSAIRYYESIHLLPLPNRVSGRRRYDAEILDRLAFIQVAQKLGFTLTEIQQLFHQQEKGTSLSENWQALARQKLAEVDTIIEHAHSVKKLLVQGLSCECSDIYNCIDCVLVNCTESSGG
jgi:MerR family transcriptional regulator, redox-sensitive transcriptional activator SoxR